MRSPSNRRPRPHLLRSTLRPLSNAALRGVETGNSPGALDPTMNTREPPPVLCPRPCPEGEGTSLSCSQTSDIRTYPRNSVP